MNKHELKYPITVNGATISSVTIRRPKGGDMVVIGDQVAELMKFYTANAKAAQEIAVADAAAKLAGTEADFEAIAAKMTPPTSKVFSAMIDIAACLAGLGDGAAELDVTDLQDIAGKALNTGEVSGRGTEQTGDE
jgi:phosphoribosylformylglycinamidine (FGAM) synthase-like enzyme